MTSMKICTQHPASIAQELDAKAHSHKTVTLNYIRQCMTQNPCTAQTVITVILTSGTYDNIKEPTRTLNHASVQYVTSASPTQCRKRDTNVQVPKLWFELAPDPDHYTW